MQTINTEKMEETYVTFNLNNYVKVKLTDKGFQKWHERYLPYSTLTLKERKLSADSEGYVQFQGWEFMSIFGQKPMMGASEYFSLDIRIEKDQFK